MKYKQLLDKLEEALLFNKERLNDISNVLKSIDNRVDDIEEMLVIDYEM